ncbi:MAG TPA: hypothetical protein ENL22_01470 [candidate division Zixibacteria bacterium]|nr:hypothetical protein [candidate division Zixibacteria bacterium]
MKTPMTLFDFRDIYEKKFIKEKIESSRWNISKVARQLDISRTTLYDLLEKYGIAKNKTR